MLAGIMPESMRYTSLILVETLVPRDNNICRSLEGRFGNISCSKSCFLFHASTQDILPQMNASVRLYVVMNIRMRWRRQQLSVNCAILKRHHCFLRQQMEKTPPLLLETTNGERCY